ncbi:glycosyltransferase [Weissella cibaria]
MVKKWSNFMCNDELPDFSVLMSVYQKEKPVFLDQALMSIEEQTVIPDQIVLVEDGPLTAELDKVIEEHQKRFSNKYGLLKLTSNRGLGAALQKGVERCRYDWIARMDSDDVSVPKRFELQLKAVVNNPQLAIVGGQIDEFTGEVNHITGKRLVPTGQEDIYQFVKWRSPFTHPSVMLNKKAILDVGNYQANGKYPVLNLSEVLVHMRVNTGMYGRRGEWANLKQIFKLRRMLYKGKLVSRRE